MVFDGNYMVIKGKDFFFSGIGVSGTELDKKGNHSIL
jgi:hypothetical protein